MAPLRQRERQPKAAEAELRSLAAAPTLRAVSEEIRREAMRVMEDWRGLLGRNVGTSRQDAVAGQVPGRGADAEKSGVVPKGCEEGRLFQPATFVAGIAG